MTMKVYILKENGDYKAGFEGFVERKVGVQLCQNKVAVPWCQKDRVSPADRKAIRKAEVDAEKAAKKAEDDKEKAAKKAADEKAEAKKAELLKKKDEPKEKAYSKVVKKRSKAYKKQ